LILFTEVWMAVVAIILATVTIGGLISPLMLLVLTFALAAGDAFESPTWRAVLPELVSKEDLPSAAALNGIEFNICSISLVRKTPVGVTCFASYPEPKLHGCTEPWSSLAGHERVSRQLIQSTALNIRIAPDSRTPESFAGMHFEFYRFLFDTRATNSSNLESRSFRMGDWFDFL